MHWLTFVSSTVVLLLLLNGIHCNTEMDINVLQQIIDRLTDAEKQKLLQSLSANSDQGRKDNSNWCCSTDPGVEATAQTRQITYTVQRHARTKCGYSGCGLFGWSSCTRWCDNYWSELQYGVETYMVYRQRLCPASNLVCCAGFITVINHCFTYQEVMNNKDILEMIVALGIPINPTMG